MTSSNLETYRQTILHLLNKSVRNAQKIHKLTSISLSTIKYNIKKLKETGTLAHRKGRRRLHNLQQGFSGSLFKGILLNY